MKNTSLITFIVVCVTVVLIHSALAEGFRAVKVIEELQHGSGKIGTYHALIIGIKEYMDPKIPDLETPLNDAYMMADLLKNKYGFSVETILDKNATRKSIYNSLRDLTSKVKQNDSVLIYYAGHGDLDRQYNDGWWIPSDAKAGDPTTYLENVQVQKAMRSMKARHVLLISDSCYAGTLFGQTRALPLVIENKYYLNLYNLKSRWGLTSGNKAPVADDGTGGHSIFAFQLIKALKLNTSPYLSIQEIYTSIAPIISNNSVQIPLCRPIRNTGDQGGEFIFILFEKYQKEPSLNPNLKIGSVGILEILRESKPGKQATREISKLIPRMEKYLNKWKKKIVKLKNKFEKEAPQLTKKERNKRKEEIKAEIISIKSKAKKFENELADIRKLFDQKLMKELTECALTKGNEDDFDIILNKDKPTISDAVFISSSAIYNDLEIALSKYPVDSIDITDKIDNCIQGKYINIEIKTSTSSLPKDF